MDAIQRELLEQVADLHEVPEGAYNIRANGEMAGRNTTAHSPRKNDGCRNAPRRRNRRYGCRSRL